MQTQHFIVLHACAWEDQYVSQNCNSVPGTHLRKTACTSRVCTLDPRGERYSLGHLSPGGAAARHGGVAPLGVVDLRDRGSGNAGQVLRIETRGRIFPARGRFSSSLILKLSLPF